METAPQSQPPDTTPAPSLSLWQRTVAIYAWPTRAWAGLDRRGQWWFPLLITILVSAGGMGLVYQRAMVPTVLATYERQVEAGTLPPEALDRMEQQIASPFGMLMNVGTLVVSLPLITMATALLPWLAASFILGRRLKYRAAFAITAWAGLTQIPASILTYALAWTNETMSSLHVGFGALLPAEDPPSKLMAGLGMFLDSVGPFSIWYVAVLILGAAALSGAPRRPLAFALGGLWVVVMAVLGTLTGLFSPGA